VLLATGFLFWQRQQLMSATAGVSLTLWLDLLSDVSKRSKDLMAGGALSDPDNCGHAKCLGDTKGHHKTALAMIIDVIALKMSKRCGLLGCDCGLGQADTPPVGMARVGTDAMALLWQPHQLPGGSLVRLMSTRRRGNMCFCHFFRHEQAAVGVRDQG
jgi:hypothetical protein